MSDRKFITRDIFVVETDETHVFMRSSVGKDQMVTIRFSNKPSMEEVKIAVKVLNLCGEGAFGKTDWKKPFPVKRNSNA